VQWKEYDFMAKRNAQGNGTIRHRSDGTWEARYTYQDELGQPKRASVYGKTQKECRQKLTSILKQIDEGSFHRTVQKYTVSEWMAEWINTYCTNLKPLTVQGYQSKINRYIIPNLGKSQLSALKQAVLSGIITTNPADNARQKPDSSHGIQRCQGASTPKGEAGRVAAGSRKCLE
jgi:integrase